MREKIVIEPFTPKDFLFLYLFWFTSRASFVSLVLHRNVTKLNWLSSDKGRSEVAAAATLLAW